MNNLREQRDPELRIGSSMDFENDKELTLSTATVLGIFAALVLSWAIFFGFGYTMGRKSLQTPSPSTADSSDTNNEQSDKFKPSAGTQNTPAPSPSPVANKTSAATDTTSNTTLDPPAPVSAPAETPARPVSMTKPAPPERTPAPVSTPAQPATTPIATQVANTTPSMVQIAAVSHKEDADVLTAALARRGYKVVARSDAGDHLIHVQVGPFSSRKDAEAMRARLLSDGYNAILK